MSMKFRIKKQGGNKYYAQVQHGWCGSWQTIQRSHTQLLGENFLLKSGLDEPACPEKTFVAACVLAADYKEYEERINEKPEYIYL